MEGKVEARVQLTLTFSRPNALMNGSSYTHSSEWIPQVNAYSTAYSPQGKA